MAARSMETAQGSPVAVLRGAGVEVDGRRIGRVATAVFLGLLGSVSVALAVVGADHNARIELLQRQGMAAQVTVSSCTGALGGSGSNSAGYTCRGTYALGSRRYTADIPGNVLRTPGSVLRGVVAPGDPGLLDTQSALRSQQASWHVYLAPALVFAVTVIGTALLVRRSRSRRETS